MRGFLKAIVVLVVGTMIAGCVAVKSYDYVNATAWSANYTDDYIQDFELQTVEGKRLFLSGIRVKEFSKGGTGGSECCSSIPGVGQAIKVVWRVGGYNDDKSTWKTYSRDVAVIGSMPMEKDAYNVLMVRFFPDRQVEAELIPDRGKAAPASPRIDKLFYGQRVMRHIGE